MQSSDHQMREAVGWLRDLGLDQRELLELNPCVPGEFTMPEAYYVNSGSPRIVYRGTNEGSLPLVAGMWFLIPNDVIDRHPDMRRDTVSVARAPRLIG